jgi:hypothetical protein
MLACGGSTSRPATAPDPATASAAPAAQQSPACPDAVMESGKQQGGACMEPAVLGEDVVRRCDAYLQQHGWKHDEAAEQAISAQTQKTLRCYRAPGADGL